MKNLICKKGNVLGSWELMKYIESGGSGEVWIAVDSKKSKYAIKILKKRKLKSYYRFCDEVRVSKKNSDIKGILPIIDYYLPSKVENHFKVWYVMPLAIPFDVWGKDKNTQEIIEAIMVVAETMAELHRRKVYHRDIKPKNLFYLEGSCFVGDLGLVTYPEKKDLTKKGEMVGPIWTMAPEMKRYAEKAEGGPADTYSLAKTLWIALTKEKKGFEGQYVKDTSIGLKRYLRGIYIKPLDELIAESTDNDASKRPTMEQFGESLKEWIKLENDYDKQNKDEWWRIQKNIFFDSIPQRTFWVDLKQIVKILNMLGESKDFNHMFFPDGGGLDLEQAKISITEKGCIELKCNGLIRIVKPKRLVFESCSDDSQWNYFRLETGGLKSINQGLDIHLSYEPFTEIRPGEYVDYSAWDEGEYNGVPLPETARTVLRFFKGNFVIFCKKSIYNKDHSTYDGRHNKMSTDEFRNYIERSAKHLEKQQRLENKR